VTRLEIVAGKKRQWLPGLLLGAVLGVAMGFAVPVDPVACQVDANYSCSRGDAVGLLGGTLAVAGAGIGALVHKDVWTPVGIDALGPPPGRLSLAAPGARVAHGGLAFGLSVRF
jgi:hypothetical protein